MPPLPPCRHCGQPRIIATSQTTGCCAGERLDWARTSPIPEPWKPTRDQVRAAAMAFARVSGAEWMKLPPSSREDFLIDGHAALMAAHHASPIPGPVPGAVGSDVVCMTRAHADLYARLFKVCDEADWLIATKDHARLVSLADQRGCILAQLRALASPEGTTP